MCTIGSPPYKPEDEPNPLNFYGETKAAGEAAVSAHSAGKGMTLRVPILCVCFDFVLSIRTLTDQGMGSFQSYGETEHNSETAVNVLLDIVQDRSGKTYKSGF